MGDIAIDDFTFKQGSCAIVPSNAAPGAKTTVSTTTTGQPTTLPPPCKYEFCVYYGCLKDVVGRILC